MIVIKLKGTLLKVKEAFFDFVVKKSREIFEDDTE